MRNIALSSYIIEAKRPHSRSLERTDDLDGDDLLDVFDGFLAQQKAGSNNTQEKTLVRVITYRRSRRECFGVIETGEYGYSSNLVDVQSLVVSYSRKPGEAGMIPFFFHIYLPPKSTEGLLVLQRFGNFGIRGMFTEEFRSYLQKVCPNFNVSFKPIVHPEQLGTYSKGGVVKRVTFRQLQVPPDVCDAYEGLAGEDAYVEYSIVAKRDANLPIFRRWLRGLSNPAKSRPYIINDPPHFQSNRVLLEVELNGHTRTIDVSKTDKLRAYFDITDRVKLAPNGHPTFKSVLAESRKLVADIWRSLKEGVNAGKN